MDSSRDDWAEGPGLLASIREFPAILPGLLLIGLLAGGGWSWTRPVEYSGTVRIFVADGVQQSSDPGRLVRSRAQFLSSPEVLSSTARLMGGAQTGEQLKRRFTVTPATDANVITVIARGPTGAEATKLADAVVNAYLVVLDQQGKASATASLAALNVRATELTRQLGTLDANRLKKPTDTAVLAQIQGKRDELVDVTKQREQLASAPPSSLQAVSHREAAVASTEPVAPRRVRSALVGGVLGLLLGCGLAWWFAGRWASARAQPRVTPRPVPGAVPRAATVSMPPPARPAEHLVAASDAVVDVTDPPDGVMLRRVAESLWQNLGAEGLVLLLERQGSLDRVASIGIPQEGGASSVVSADADPAAVRKLLEGGPLLAGEPERQLLESLGVRIDTDGSLLVVPLVDGDGPAFGLAVVGQGDAAGGARWLGTDDVEHVTALVAEAVPPLHAWWVLRGLALASGRSTTGARSSS